VRRKGLTFISGRARHGSERLRLEGKRGEERELASAAEGILVNVFVLECMAITSKGVYVKNKNFQGLHYK
jgi:hypothetical protein